MCKGQVVPWQWQAWWVNQHPVWLPCAQPWLIQHMYLSKQAVAYWQMSLHHPPGYEASPRDVFYFCHKTSLISFLLSLHHILTIAGCIASVSLCTGVHTHTGPQPCDGFHVTTCAIPLWLAHCPSMPPWPTNNTSLLAVMPPRCATLLYAMLLGT